MKTKLLVAAAITVTFAGSALADFYVVENQTTHKCTIVSHNQRPRRKRLKLSCAIAAITANRKPKFRRGPRRLAPVHRWAPDCLWKTRGTLLSQKSNIKPPKPHNRASGCHHPPLAEPLEGRTRCAALLFSITVRFCVHKR